MSSPDMAHVGKQRRPQGNQWLQASPFLLYLVTLCATLYLYGANNGNPLLSGAVAWGIVLGGAALGLLWSSIRRDRSLTNRGWPAYLLASSLTHFYVVLYYTETFTPLAKAIWADASKWTLYGALYSLAVLLGGTVFILKNRRSRYQVVRTLVIIGVQLSLAFVVPIWMKLFSGDDFYFSYLWPLKIEYFYPSVIFKKPVFFAAYSFLGSLVLVPLLAFFFGKRWYCSWVCGCGGLANTLGDPWRHLSSKSRRAWRLESVSIHLVLLLALSTTAVVLINWAVGKQNPQFASFAFALQKHYGFFIGALWSGIAGVALYPLFGTRIWCRFGCPMAALLGLIQTIGRFQISSQGELCIGCGNCSKYCEMGIDVRSYAQKGEPIKRASCVGCGMCAHVCPRGVLRLENKKISPI